MKLEIKKKKDIFSKKKDTTTIWHTKHFLQFFKYENI